MSYNEVSELFDIGFLEQLQVLDMEGNNVKSLDQLFYFNRCQKLTEVNLKNNPVSKEISYFQKIQENVPLIKSLDDEDVDEGFFERKIEEAKVSTIKKNVTKSNQ